jgi:hypothetical protein
LFLNGECDHMLKGISLHSHTFPSHKGSAFGCLLYLGSLLGRFPFVFLQPWSQAQAQGRNTKAKVELGSASFFTSTHFHLCRGVFTLSCICFTSQPLSWFNPQKNLMSSFILGKTNCFPLFSILELLLHPS